VIDLVLFVDIDGVLGSQRVWDANAVRRWTCPAGWLEPQLVARLNRVVRETGARVVISSGWRHYLGAESVVEVLWACGFTGEVIGATPKAPVKTFTWQRALEIEMWLSQNPARHWVAVDDVAVAVESGRLVRTNPKTGLTDADVQTLIKLLKENGDG
jgi:hypothetical protein